MLLLFYGAPPTEAPLKPVRVQIVNVTESSVKLTWIEPYDGNGHITKYLARVSDALTNESVATGHSSHTNVTVDGLRPDRPYRVEVSAENEVGWSEASDAVPFRTEEGAPSGAPVSVTAVATGPNSIKLSWKVIARFSCPSPPLCFHGFTKRCSPPLTLFLFLLGSPCVFSFLSRFGKGSV